MSRAVVRAGLLHMLPDYLEKVGVKAEPIFRKGGITLRDLDSSVLVHRAQIHCILSLAARVTGTPEIGLALGSAADSTKLGPTGLAFIAGDTMEQCLRGHIALMNRLQSQVEVKLSVHGPSAILSHRLLGDGHLAWHLYEGAAAFHLRQLREINGARWSPDLVTFPHACQGRRTTYVDFFGCEVTFGLHEESRIYFASTDLDKKRATSPLRPKIEKPDLAPIGLFCPVQIEHFEYDATRLLNACGNMIEATLPHGALTLAAAAERIGLPSRTIQRRLKEQNTTFEQVVDSLRCKISLARLRETRETVTEIAMSLGYSDTAHFNRAFHRWTGYSPLEYRRHAAKES